MDIEERVRNEEAFMKVIGNFFIAVADHTPEQAVELLTFLGYRRNDYLEMYQKPDFFSFSIADPILLGEQTRKIADRYLPLVQTEYRILTTHWQWDDEDKKMAMDRVLEITNRLDLKDLVFFGHALRMEVKEPLFLRIYG
tara:strand:+ start:5431 stop:5850 length:420 start_codon:yes stop_codon:yes gene_type:complete